MRPGNSQVRLDDFTGDKTKPDESIEKTKQEIPEGWSLKQLKEACKIKPSKAEVRTLPNDLEVTFVPMAAVDEMRGCIESPSVRRLGEVRKRYTFFREGDVLFAKITPCMENGKSAIARGLVNAIGFGSTEFHVIRPSKDMIAEWVFYFIRQKSFRELAARSMTGSVGQQRVPKWFLEDAEIPVPPFDVQRRVVARIEEIISRIEQSKRLREEAQVDAEAILQSALHQAFSTAEEEKWNSDLIEKVAPIQSSSIQNLEADKLYNYISLGHIEPGTGRLVDFSQTRGADIKSSKTAFTREHVLYGKLRPYLNKVFVPAFQGICTTELVPLLPQKDVLTREFLAWQLRSPQFVNYAMSNITGTRMPRISMDALKGAKIACPPIEEQKRIVARLNDIQARTTAMNKHQKEAMEGLELTTQAILKRAFAGKL